MCLSCAQGNSKSLLSVKISDVPLIVMQLGPAAVRVQLHLFNVCLLHFFMHAVIAAVCAKQSNATADKAGTAGKPGGLKSVLEGLEELWDENQYAEEFSLQNFTSKMSVD